MFPFVTPLSSLLFGRERRFAGVLRARGETQWFNRSRLVDQERLLGSCIGSRFVESGSIWCLSVFLEALYLLKIIFGPEENDGKSS